MTAKIATRRTNRRTTRRVGAAVAVTGIAAAMLSMTACSAQDSTQAASHPAHAPAAVAVAVAKTGTGNVINAQPVAAIVQTAPDPGKYVPGMWLSTKQLPFGASIDWQSASDLEGTHLAGTVFEVTDPDQERITISCAASSFTTGLTGTQFQAAVGPENGNITLGDGTIAAEAYQDYFYYKDSASADAAWTALATGYASCGRTESGVDVTTGMTITGATEQTYSGTDAMCWSNLQKSQQAGAGTVSNDCFVRRGDQIESVTILVNQDGSFSTVDFPAIDPTTVATMRQTW